MEIIKNPIKVTDCALALGNFDGVHRAHTKIIKNCVKYARENNLKSGVLLFENHTDTLLKESKIKLLTTLNEKLDEIEKTGIHFVFLLEFNEELMKTSPENFFEFLINTLRAKALFAGYDYSFGHMATGDASLLCRLGNESGIKVLVCKKIDIENSPVSSTKIRELIKSGDIKKANLHLGRCYSLFGKVVWGKQNGRLLGFPTANIDYDKNKLIPGDGVYFGYTIIDDKKFKSLINIGKNPTFNAEKRTVETHIIGFCGELYESFIKIEFEDKIRDEIKFNSTEELKEQINTALLKIAEMD